MPNKKPTQPIDKIPAIKMWKDDQIRQKIKEVRNIEKNQNAKIAIVSDVIYEIGLPKTKRTHAIIGTTNSKQSITIQHPTSTGWEKMIIPLEYINDALNKNFTPEQLEKQNFVEFKTTIATQDNDFSVSTNELLLANIRITSTTTTISFNNIIIETKTDDLEKIISKNRRNQGLSITVYKNHNLPDDIEFDQKIGRVSEDINKIFRTTDCVGGVLTIFGYRHNLNLKLPSQLLMSKLSQLRNQMK